MKTNFFTILSLCLTLTNLTTSKYSMNDKLTLYHYSPKTNKVTPFKLSSDMFQNRVLIKVQDNTLYDLNIDLKQPTGFIFVKNPKNTDNTVFDNDDFIRINQAGKAIRFGTFASPTSSKTTDIFKVFNFVKSQTSNMTMKTSITFVQYVYNLPYADYYNALFSHETIMNIINPSDNEYNLNLNAITSDVVDAKVWDADREAMIKHGFYQYIFDFFVSKFEIENDLKKRLVDHLQGILTELLNVKFKQFTTYRLTNSTLSTFLNGILNDPNAMNIMVEAQRKLYGKAFMMPGTSLSDEQNFENKKESIDILYYALMDMVFDNWTYNDNILLNLQSKEIMGIVNKGFIELVKSDFFGHIWTEYSIFGLHCATIIQEYYSKFNNYARIELFHFFDANKPEIIEFLTLYYDTSMNVESFTNVFVNLDSGEMDVDKAIMTDQYMNPTLPDETDVEVEFVKSKRRRLNLV